MKLEGLLESSQTHPTKSTQNNKTMESNNLFENELKSNDKVGRESGRLYGFVFSGSPCSRLLPYLLIVLGCLTVLLWAHPLIWYVGPNTPQCARCAELPPVSRRCSPTPSKIYPLCHSPVCCWVDAHQPQVCMDREAGRSEYTRGKKETSDSSILPPSWSTVDAQHVEYSDHLPIVQPAMCAVQASSRIDCYPGYYSNESLCTQRGCCWASDPGFPYCYFPVDGESTYKLVSASSQPFGVRGHLVRSVMTGWPREVVRLNIDIMLETPSRLHFKVYDPSVERFEVPIDTPTVSNGTGSSDYDIILGPPGEAFSFTVLRKSTGVALFNLTDSPLIFSDQFLQLTTSVPASYIYGLGERRGSLGIPVRSPNTFAFWNLDQPPCVGCNLYGTHPLAIGLEENGAAYGVFLLNSNAMEVSISPGPPSPTLTFTTIGGILDFYVYTGPSVDDVVRQHTAVVGRPYLPPYWALGYHLCRWGYNTSSHMESIVNRMLDNGFPYDTQWNDIDYMNNRHDWTYNSTTFEGLPGLVKKLHDRDMHYILIVDPGTPNITGYRPYDQGREDGIFVREASGSAPIIGRVWPGFTAFPDFWNPLASDWWTTQAKRLHDVIPFDGLWTDMNEPSNFVDGSVDGCPGNSPLDNPPFTPHVLYGDLKHKTLCPSAQQYLSTHYNLHNLYGYSEQAASQKALHALRPGRRTVVISRSTFSGSGKFGGHWTGDNEADWDNLKYSISGILSMNLFGIPFVGADICGFNGDTTEELCVRWTQLGAFYPFMRNHNSLASVDQDPAAPMFSSMAKGYMKRALFLRYSLLPYLYTLLAASHMNGFPVARPLFAQYPQDRNTYTIDEQFLWGDGLLIAPVLQEGASLVSVYFPNDVWFDWYTGAAVIGKGAQITVEAPLDTIPLYQRAGTVIPVQETDNATVTTAASRKNNFTLFVALDHEGTASGHVFLDDGESLHSLEQGSFTEIQFYAVGGNKLTGVLSKGGYDQASLLTRVRLRGTIKTPTTATFNGNPIVVNLDNPLEPTLEGFSVPLSHFGFTLEWY